MESCIIGYTHQFPETTTMIGKGSFGKVYKTFHELDQKMYAIKKILLTRDIATQVLREVRILSSANHVNIVRYFSSWVEKKPVQEVYQDMTDEDEEEEEILIKKNECYYVCIQMEYCISSLAVYLRLRTDQQMVIPYMKQMILGIKYLHENGWVHRDLKPENILIASGNQIKISDFSLVKEIRDTLPDSGKKNTRDVGTITYASPEQIKGLAYGCEADIYSLGIIYFEMRSCFKTTMERYRKIRRLCQSETIDAHVRDHQVILRMIGQPSLRPSIQELYHFFHEEPFLFCRDLVWQIMMDVFVSII